MFDAKFRVNIKHDIKHIQIRRYQKRKGSSCEPETSCWKFLIKDHELYRGRISMVGNIRRWRGNRRWRRYPQPAGRADLPGGEGGKLISNSDLNVVESSTLSRNFSSTKHIITVDTTRMNPSSCENQISLKINSPPGILPEVSFSAWGLVGCFVAPDKTLSCVLSSRVRVTFPSPWEVFFFLIAGGLEDMEEEADEVSEIEGNGSGNFRFGAVAVVAVDVFRVLLRCESLLCFRWLDDNLICCDFLSESPGWRLSSLS